MTVPYGEIHGKQARTVDKEENVKDSFEEKAKQWDANPAKIELTEKFIREIGKNIEIDPSFKVLDFGCGTGLVGLSFYGKVDSLVMVDTSRAMLSVLRDKIQAQGLTAIEVLEGDIKDLRIPLSSIDLIVSSLVFHHVDDIPGVVTVMRNILKDNGMIVISDVCKEDGSFHGAEFEGHTGFDSEEITNDFVDCGMRVEKVYVYNVIKKPDATGKVNEYDQFILIARKTND